MEKTRYWMLTRRKLGEMPFLGAQIPALAVSSSYDESWEELAFARDSAGHIGGCIWPPRSYSCSFCRREFRSAQALGGHMNVHRKDRAMLKQSSSPSEETLESSHHHLASCTPTGTAHPSPIASLEHSTAVNPNPNSSFSASSISPGVSATSRQERNEQNPTYPFYSSSIVPKNLKGSLFSTARTLKESVTLQLFTVPELNLNKMDSFDQTGRDKLGLGEVNFRRRQDGDEKDEQNMCSKRRRTDSVPAFFVKPSSGERQLPQSEVLKHDTGPVEELDLELRLGDTPQVK